MEFSYSQIENFEMEKLSSDTGYFKKPVEISFSKTIKFLFPFFFQFMTHKWPCFDHFWSFLHQIHEFLSQNGHGKKSICL
jgi:hypothetical protein